MSVHYADDWLTVHQGDCREVMAGMEPESVHCVVTSPPYWGLRDYGEAGQLGLEPTPELYVAAMVEVFRAVRRVLRADGTVWLNLGASFAGGDRTTGRNDAVRQGKQTGGGFEAGPRTKIGAGGSGPSPSRQPERAPAYGSDGTGRQGSSAPGSAYSDLCGECQAVLSPRTTDTPQPQRVSPLRSSLTGRDTEPPGSGPASPDASPLDVPVSTTTQSETPPPGPCSHCGNCGACLSVLRSSSRDARVCGRKSWLNYTTFKPKDMVPIPWMVAMALQADGWYLRSDIIWSKPNPMPESVTDRPTKAHEYLFLLSKSARYFYDADAVREDYSGPMYEGRNNGAILNGDRNDRGKTIGMSNPAGRNLRSVWTIATQPYPGAHFATFPEALVEPCIKAGSPEGGTVLDPFGGSGTTARVANRLSRRAILIDLSTDYLDQAMVRNSQSPMGLVG